MRTMITDPMWALLEPRLRPTGRNACGGKPRLPDRQFLEALLYLARTGIPWRDLPGDFGAWDAVYNRFRRWINNGRLRKLFEGFTEHPELGEIPRLLVDSTILRAHAHAAGAPRKKSTSGPNARPKSKAWAAAGAVTAPKSSSPRPTRTPPSTSTSSPVNATTPRF
jgi:transposase